MPAAKASDRIAPSVERLIESSVRGRNKRGPARFSHCSPYIPGSNENLEQTMTLAGTKDHPITIEPIHERVQVIWRGRAIGDSRHALELQGSELSAGGLRPARGHGHERARTHRPGHDLPVQGRGELLLDRRRQGPRRQRGVDLRASKIRRGRDRDPISHFIPTRWRLRGADERSARRLKRLKVSPALIAGPTPRPRRWAQRVSPVHRVLTEIS